MKLQSFFGDVSSVLKVYKLNTNCAIKFYKSSRKKRLPNVHQKMFSDMKRADKAFSWLFIHLLFNKRTELLEKTHPSVITLLMANIVWTILIPQNYIDFNSWENRTCMHKKTTVKSYSNK